MNRAEFAVGDTVVTRKKHPCGGDRWEVIRDGADVKLRCLTCGCIVCFSRADFLHRVKSFGKKES